jgi:hypothetical protein
LREIARVLRPRGILAILFNQLAGEFEPPLPESFWQAYHSLAIEKPPPPPRGLGVEAEVRLVEAT